ncbi:MAG: hypothetical protein ACO25F_03875 [Erythrobacter sp.]
MLQRLLRLLFLGLVPVAGASAADQTEAQKQFEAQLALDQRVQDTGWRLVTGNARFCPKTVAAIGLQLHDMASYGDPAEARRAFGIAGDIAVLTSARASPAASATLPPHTTIAKIDGVAPGSWPASPPGDWRRTVRVHDWIEARLAEQGAVTLTLANGEDIRLEASKACATRFELGGPGKRALAEGARVVVERDFPGLDYPEDELAAALAHELAHNQFGHRAWLDANGRSQGNIRLTEREADRLMPWLLANAGYDPAAAIRFMQRWGPRHSGGLLRKRSHDGWDERAEAITAEVALVNQARDATGAADWRSGFRRELPGRP